MSCACLSCAHLVSTVPPESIAFPSRNVCHTCLLLVLCLSLFPPESIAFPSSARCVLLCCCCVLLHVLLCVCYCMCSCSVLPLCAAAVCYCMIDHACLLLVLSCLVLLRCSLHCVSYHSTHHTYNGVHTHSRTPTFIWVVQLEVVASPPVVPPVAVACPPATP